MERTPKRQVNLERHVIIPPAFASAPVENRPFVAAADIKSNSSLIRDHAPENHQLSRVLNFRDLVFLIIGTVIGSGIFLVPGAVLRTVANSVPLALAVWFTGGMVSLLGALTYGELSAMMPKAGGLYVFIRDAFGPFLAFLFGWTLFLVISTGSVATLAVAFSAYIAEFLPLTFVEGKLIALAMIVVIAAVNVHGTRDSADLQNVMTAVKVGAIVIMSGVLLWLGRNSTGGDALPLSLGALSSGFGMAMISVLWAYEGWQYATFSAGETIHPQRNFPRAFLTGSACLVAIYLLANVGYLKALGSAQVAASNRVAATAVSAVIGGLAGKIVALAILISIFSAANSVVLTASRVYFAMASDGLFFRRLSEVHPRFGTPAFSVIATAGWAAILAASGTFEQLLTYVIFVGWMFYALAAASVFVYRRRNPKAERPYKVPGYPITPAIFILAAAVLVLNTIVTQPLRGAVGIGIVMTGLPAYMIWRRLRKAN